MNDLRRFSVLPIRAVSLVKKGRTLRVLAALCAHTSPTGICYPAQERIKEMKVSTNRTFHGLFMSCGRLVW